jgi:hypothetical protein
LGRPAEGFVGCTIDPTQEAMVRLQGFQRTVPHAVPEAQRAPVGLKIAEGMRSALGLAPIRVFGVPPDTHLAQVLIEADYRMKLIGLGLERPPVRFASYFDLLSGANIRTSALQRWWFTPNYECVKVTADRLAMELVGEGVQLLTESKLIGADGQLKSGAPGNRASDTFTEAFTQKYPPAAGLRPTGRLEDGRLRQRGGHARADANRAPAGPGGGQRGLAGQPLRGRGRRRRVDPAGRSLDIGAPARRQRREGRKVAQPGRHHAARGPVVVGLEEIYPWIVAVF